MSDCLKRGFQAQLTASMDSILRRAVFEIMTIFENSLRDHQLELAQKGEEVAQLKIKLQKAALKLSDIEGGGDRGAEMNRVDVPSAPEQSTDVPEIDFEVPDDWCAPLGCDTMVKEGDGFCPCVRLRPLSISLWPLPINKQEINRNSDSHQRTKGLRRSRRGSSLNKKHKHKEEGNQHPPVRNNMKKLIQDIKQEYADQTDGTGLRRRRRSLTEKEQATTTTKSKQEERQITATEAEQSGSENRYSCRFCKKEFNTVFGRDVHVRSHKKCRGCKRDFPFPSALRYHEASCKKLKKMLAKKAQSTDPPKPESSDEVKVQSTPSTTSQGESSAQKDGSTKKHSCVHCNKKFHDRWRLKEHERVHTGERPYLCRICPKKFRVNQSLKKHVTRMHKDQTVSSETNEMFEWTKPLDETESISMALMSPVKTQVEQFPIKMDQNNVQRDRNPDMRRSPRWQTMGTRCPDGFICILCNKLLKNQYLLIKHFRTHTGEKPFKCDWCPAEFHYRGQLSMHRKRCPNVTVTAMQCAKCKKTFNSQKHYMKHMPNCHRDRPKPNLCKVCGKGFFLKGHLRNHMERFHK